jgi:IS5 family transposase
MLKALISLCASTFKGNLIVGARAFHGNPYDGHTLSARVEQAGILMQDCGHKPTTAFLDLGYRGVDAQNPDVRIVHRGKARTTSAQERRQLRRREAIEPIIRHLKADHRMDPCHLKGEQGDRMHAVLYSAGYNFKWLLRMIAKKGAAFLLRRLCLRLCEGAGPCLNGLGLQRELATLRLQWPVPRLATVWK